MDLIDVGGAQMMPSVNQIEVQPWWHEDVRVNTPLPVFINMIARHWEEASLSQSRVPSYPSVFFSFLIFSGSRCCQQEAWHCKPRIQSIGHARL